MIHSAVAFDAAISRVVRTETERAAFGGAASGDHVGYLIELTRVEYMAAGLSSTIVAAETADVGVAGKPVVKKFSNDHKKFFYK